MEACRHWKAGVRRPDASTPVVPAVPALLFSGDLDPVTPPRFSDEVVRTLRNGRHIVLKNSGHAIGDAASCITSMIKRLIDTADARQPDAACASGSR